jgi:hypothetical protein
MIARIALTVALCEFGWLSSDAPQIERAILGGLHQDFGVLNSPTRDSVRFPTVLAEVDRPLLTGRPPIHLVGLLDEGSREAAFSLWLLLLADSGRPMTADGAG